MEQSLHVAVGVIRNADGQILIAQRAKNAHLGGLWEFPGGKVEAGESVPQALQRELAEELGIEVGQISPLIKVKHRYPGLNVLLDVWNVESFSGEAQGLEGQPVRWVQPDELPHYEFPEANQPIITATRLPRWYAIVEAYDEKQMLADLKTVLDKGVKLVQLRLKSPTADSFKELCIRKAISQCHSHQARVLLNSGWQLTPHYVALASGWHLTSMDLMRCRERPDTPWVAASCHDEAQLRKAESLGVDFVVIAPVQVTQSHPDAEPMGWERLQALIESSHLPAYALGGISQSDLGRAMDAGAIGIAGIRAFL